MSAPNHDHPDRSELEAFGVGLLDPAGSAVVEKHVAGCESCCEAVQKAPDDTLVNQLREAATLPPFPAPAASTPPGQETIGHPSSAADAPVQAPDDLARHPRYRLLKLLGAGGMGAVYQAEHGVMRRLVALKVINREYTSNWAAAERFQREIRAAAQLHHPNIVGAYDAEQAGETHFLVMEYIDGVSLDRLLAEKGPLPVAEACECARQAALGLQHAHERGMVHRDVKPHNLIRSADGVVKVLDFGLASASERGDGQLTGTNVIMGTPDYISPEQAEDTHAADARSDVYSLGCTLYHLLTGRPPFTHPSTLLKLVAHREEAPAPVRLARPDVPEELATVLGRMMAKAPVDRYQTAAQVAAALAPFADATALPTPRLKSRRRRWVAAAVAAVCLAGVAAGIAAVVVHIQTEQGEVSIQTDDPNIEVVVTKGGKLVRIVDPQSKQTWQLDPEKFELSMADQPDGLTIALDGKAPFSLKRKGEKLVTIAREPAPDGKAPIADADGEVRRIQWDKLAYGQVSFSPDGRSILAGSYSGMARVWNLSTGELRFELGGTCAAYTPDGKYILSGLYDLRLSDAETGKLVHGPVKAPQLYDLGMSPDSKTAWIISPDGLRLWSLPDLKQLHWWPTPAHDLWDRALPHYSSSGKYLFLPAEKPPLSVWDVAADKEVDVFPGLADYAFCREAPAGGDDRQVWAEGQKISHYQVIDAVSGTVLRSLNLRSHWRKATPASVDITSAFDPGIRRMLQSYEDGSVWLYDLDSGNVLARFAMKNSVANMICFSPDGRYAAGASKQGTIVVWRLPDSPADKPGEAPAAEPGTGADAGRAAPAVDKITQVLQVQLPGAEIVQTDVSKDGLYFLAAAGGRLDVWDGRTGDLKYGTYGERGYFTPDGGKIVVTTGKEDPVFRVYEAATGQQLRSFGKWPSGAVYSWLSPDGKAILAYGKDGVTASLWDVESEKEMHRWPATLPAHGSNPWEFGDGYFFIKPDGKTAYLTWDLRKNQEVEKFDLAKVKSISKVLPGDHYALAAVDDETWFFDMTTGKKVAKQEGPVPGDPPYGRYLRDGLRYLYFYPDGSLRLLDAVHLKELDRFQTPAAKAYWDQAITDSPDSRFAVAGDRQGTLTLYRLPEPPRVEKVLGGP